MCSVEEDIQLEAQLKPQSGRRLLVEGKCHKCKIEPPVVDTKGVHYCRNCFIESVLYRFRINIMKSSKGPDGMKVLIAFSGGPSSRLVIEGFKRFHTLDSENSRKKRKFSEIVICHVDQSSVFGKVVDAKEAGIENLVKSSGFTYIRVPIENVFAGPDGVDPGFLAASGADANDANAHRMNMAYIANSNLTPAERLRQCFNSLGKLTAKEDMLQTLTMKAVLDTARAHGCSLAALGDNATRLAVKVVSLTSKGNGFSLPLEMAVASKWHKDITVIKPLRDVLAKEVVLFNKYENLDYAVVRDFTTGMPAKASIDRLTEAFVIGLQNDFPMTVPTVVRTGEKVSSEYLLEDTTVCPLCQGPVQYASKDWRANHTVAVIPTSEPSSTAELPNAFAKMNVGSSPHANDCTQSSCCASCPETSGGCCSSKQPNSSVIDISQHICYACQNLCQDAKDAAVAATQKRLPRNGAQQNGDSPAETKANADLRLILPPYVAHEVTKRVGRDWMRDQIADFLVVDDGADETE
ncbi:uncharacterized protein EV422DRAFT_541273 [Fimicolochytrium jonesii]|uniref:uncharacterized protein n=1 Tax=Fimicolochytrium jonesii TaxID=1396493 RepID=UPI0022FE2EEE|nr:uncharacterized protein EV422DRAFT_541273 [Fimicolochytrium jonesii]KAI8817586.1 hypothetical protein EV422DRAFT_541273 [Fimicolochytrium jonesii]